VLNVDGKRTVGIELQLVEVADGAAIDPILDTSLVGILHRQRPEGVDGGRVLTSR